MVEWIAHDGFTKMNVIDIFPTPVYVEEYPEANYIKSEVEQLISNKSLEKNVYCNELHHIGNTSDESILYNDVFDSFREWIENNSIFFIEAVLGYKIYDTVLITDSWVNISEKGAFQHPHYHTNSYISGTYYVSIDEDSAPLEFNYSDIAPFSQVQNLTLEKTNNTKYNSDVRINVKEGSLLLWPSNLTHGFCNNKSDKRISISFNIMPTEMKTGTYGFKVSLL